MNKKIFTRNTTFLTNNGKKGKNSGKIKKSYRFVA